MAFNFNFAADSVIKGKAYPALAQHRAEPYTAGWREFRHHWPYTVPCELHEHCASHNESHIIRPVDQSRPGDYYTIGLGCFDFSRDYFSLIPKRGVEKKLRMVF